MTLSKKNISYATIAVLCMLLLYVFFMNVRLSKQNEVLYTNLEETKVVYASTTAILNGQIATLQTSLEEVLGDNAEKDEHLQSMLKELVKTQENLWKEEAKIGLLTEQVTSIADVVGTVEKLATTDKELLQKYSKVFFLNEHYIPENLVLIEDEYIFDPEKRYWFHKEAYEHLKQMIIASRASGADMFVISAYRSFYSQGDLKTSYTVTYGEGANTFSADQGYSEHQLGTTVDFTDRELGTKYEEFGGTISYSWLKANAHKYGFILSYPEGNQYYIFEPWHWRFVGIALATKLKDEGKTFYEMDQRYLNNYLVSIFDKI